MFTSSNIDNALPCSLVLILLPLCQCVNIVATAGTEILICIISTLVSLRVAYRVEKEVNRKNEGTFSVTVLDGLKDIQINITNNSKSSNKTDDLKTLSADSKSESAVSEPLITGAAAAAESEFTEAVAV